jgi:hypothetical protein
MAGSQDDAKSAGDGLDLAGASPEPGGSPAGGASGLPSEGGALPTAFNADDAVVGAVISSESLSSLDRALDQLTHSVDLFDVPAVDFGVHDSHFLGSDGQG